jgi:tetratricopeptide (TPR) repeat protein
VAAALMAVSGAAHAQPAAARGRASMTELNSQLNQLATQVKNESGNLRVVETQYTERAEVTDEEAQNKQFSRAEIEHLLENYEGSSVLFYDLIANPRFKANTKYPDALFYLAEALYQQKNFLGAKVYLRELLALRSGRYKMALSRYLEIAGQLNEFDGIDEYIEIARGLAGGELPPELTYVYGKWTLRRTDLPLEERVKRARSIFETVSSRPKAPYRLQSMYFTGVAYVKVRDYEAALAEFKRVIEAPALDARDNKVKELAHLSMGRLLYEQEKFDQALDRYQEIPRESEYFVDSLYEIAWAHVKKGDYEKARDAIDILLLVAVDSTLEPEARILQGHLLLKLKRYGDSTEAYNSVINKYGPVHDEIKALIQQNADPVKYFDQLLARNDRNLEVASLLPPVALKWATTQHEVSEAVKMVSDLEAGRRGVKESEEIASRLIKTIEDRGLESFPTLQEGYVRADAVETALAAVDQSLVRIEGYLVEDQLNADEKAQLAKLRNAQEQLKVRFNSLPVSEKQVEARRDRMRTRVDTVDKVAFKLGYEIQSQYAQLAAIKKYAADTKPARRNTPEDEKGFLERVKHEEDALSGLEKELSDLRKDLSDERSSAEAVISGEDSIRKQYEEALDKQHQQLMSAEGRVTGEAREMIERAHRVRTDNQAVRERVLSAKRHLREQVTRKAQEIRNTVTAEQGLLSTYSESVKTVSGSARNLVGRIAFDSFKRVRQQFYDLVLKADVGVVDVSFTRKQDKTSEIQKLSVDKDRVLKAHDEEFREVLKDVD